MISVTISLTVITTSVTITLAQYYSVNIITISLTVITTSVIITLAQYYRVNIIQPLKG